MNKMRLGFNKIPPVDRQVNVKTALYLGLIIILATVLRLGHLAEMQNSVLPAYTSYSSAFDQHNFLSMAKDLLANDWMGSSYRDYAATYSYVIAACFKLFGTTLNSVYFLQIILGIFGVFIFYKASTLLFENKRIGLISAFIAAVYSPFLFYETVVLRASLISFCNLLGFYFLLQAGLKNKVRYLFFGGIVVGFAAILRPNILPVFVLPYILLSIKKPMKQRLLYALIYILGLLVIISPLSLRNKALGSDAIISTPGPTIFWLGNSHDSNGIGLNRTKTQQILAEETEGRVLKSLAVLIREMGEHPGDYARLYARKFKMLLNGYEIPGNISYDLAKEGSLTLKLAFLNFSIIAPLALCGMFLMWGKYRHGGLLYLFLFVLCFFVFAFHIQSRYRLPTMPFFIIFASYAVYWFYHMIVTREKRAVGYGVVVLLLFALFTKPDHAIIKKYFGHHIRGIDYSNMTDAYLHAFHRNKDRLTEEQRQELLLGAYYHRRQSVFVCAPYRKPAYLHNLGTLCLALNKLDEAKEAFELSLKFNPQNEAAKEYLKALEEHFQKFQ